MRYLGVDLHSNNFTVCFLAEDGTHTFEKYQLKELEKFQGILQPEDHVAVEATGNSRFFHSRVSPLVAECVVVNAGQFGVIKQSVSKTDRNDARALAQFLSKGLLPSSRVKGALHAQINSLAQTRDRLVIVAYRAPQQSACTSESAWAGEPERGLRPSGQPPQGSE